MNQQTCGGWTHLFLNPPFLGYHHQSCRHRKTVRYHRLHVASEPEVKPTPGFPSSGACSWTDASASAWTWEVLYVGWLDPQWHGWLIWSQLWAQGSFCLWLLKMPLWDVVLVIFTFGKREGRKQPFNPPIIEFVLSPLSDTPLPWSSYWAGSSRLDLHSYFYGIECLGSTCSVFYRDDPNYL